MLLTNATKKIGRLDPTRTTTLRRQALAEAHKRFLALKSAILKLVVEEDAFGLAKNGLVANTRWQFLTNPQKVQAFREWLKEQTSQGALATSGGGLDPNKPWLAPYIESVYKKAAVKAYIDSKPALALESPDFFAGSKAQFLDQFASSPVATKQLEMMYTRSFNALKGVDDAMAAGMSRVLTEGLAHGKQSLQIARDMNKQVDIGKARARTIARTEMAYSHAEGSLDAFEELGVTDVGVMAEWSTAGDEKVCPKCAPLEAAVFTVKEARGLLPRHPNCRCAWIPANVGEPEEEIKAKRKATAAKVDASVQQDHPKLPLSEARQKSKWLGADSKPTKWRQWTKKLPEPTPEELAAVQGAGPLATPPAAAPKPAPLPPAQPKLEPLPQKPTPPVKPPAAPPKPKPLPPAQPSLPPLKPKPEPTADLFSLKAGQKIKVDDPKLKELQKLPDSLGGSTGAMLVRGGDGKKYVLKAYGGSSEQVVNEYVADSLYNLLTPWYQPKPRITKVASGQSVLLKEYIEDTVTLNKYLETATATQKAEVLGKVQKGFVADSWMANWDVAGLGLDNILVDKAGKPVRIDNGGALLYRAKGALKGSKFGPEVNEITNMLSPSFNPSGAKVFAGIKDETVIKQIDDLLFQTMYEPETGHSWLAKRAGQIAADHGMSPAKFKELEKTLNLRLADLAKKQAELKAKVAAKAATAKQAELAEKVAKTAGAPKPVSGAGKGVSNLNKVYPYSEYSKLPSTEYDALRRYTGSSYKRINGEVLSSVKAGRSFDALIGDSGKVQRALEKLPKFEGMTFRGIKSMPNVDEKFEKWKNGEWAQVQWDAFSSSTAKPGAGFSPGPNGMMFFIRAKGKQGAYIKPISSHASEEEVLFKAGSRFRVVGWSEWEKKSSSGRFPTEKRRALVLEEVDGDIPAQQLAPRKFTKEELSKEFEESAQEAYAT